MATVQPLVTSKPDTAKEPRARSEAPTRRTRRPSPMRLAIGVGVLLAIATVAYFQTAPKVVPVIAPESVTVAETIASSGVVQGYRESTVGAQTPGIVTEILVEEGAAVRKGQVLARVQDNTAKDQAAQARQALQTARALYDQAQAGPQKSEIAAGRAHVEQTRAALGEQRSFLRQAYIAKRQATASAAEAESRVRAARSTLEQAQARFALAEKTLARKRTLAEQGAIPKASADEAEAAFAVARADVQSATEGVSAASSGANSARDAVRSAEENIRAVTQRIAAATAQVSAAESDLSTMLSLPRPEGVRVAAERVREAEAAVTAAETLMKNTDVVAPFDGTVTEIIAHPGMTVSGLGVLRLVQTGRLEVKVDLDETNLSKVRVGQRAFIALPDNPDESAEAGIARIGSQIDSQRGTLEVFVSPRSAPSWLRPGQTLNVNLVTAENVERLLIPSTAIRREGDQTVVFVIREGRATSVLVRVGAASGDQLPVLKGLSSDEDVIRNSFGIEAGMRVRAKGRR